MALIKRLKAKTDARENFILLQDWLHRRIKEIKDAPMYVDGSFWCDHCKRDFEGRGHKEVRRPPVGVFFAYYVGICPCGHFALRYITDKLLDPYYYKSKAVRMMQGQHSDDMLQPWQPRFRQLYPEQYAKLYQQMQGVKVK